MRRFPSSVSSVGVIGEAVRATPARRASNCKERPLRPPDPQGQIGYAPKRRDTRLSRSISSLLLAASAFVAGQSHALQITSLTPQGEVARIRQVVAQVRPAGRRLRRPQGARPAGSELRRRAGRPRAPAAGPARSSGSSTSRTTCRPACAARSRASRASSRPRARPLTGPGALPVQQRRPLHPQLAAELRQDRRATAVHARTQRRGHAGERAARTSGARPTTSASASRSSSSTASSAPPCSRPSAATRRPRRSRCASSPCNATAR